MATTVPGAVASEPPPPPPARPTESPHQAAVDDNRPDPARQAKTFTGLAIIGAATGLGLLGDLLLRINLWGVNIGLWLSLLAASSLVIIGWQHRPMRTIWPWLTAAVLFGGGFAWRDSAVLNALNLLALLICLAMAATYGLGGNFWRGGLLGYGLGIVVSAISTWVGALLLMVMDIHWPTLGQGGRLTRLLRVGASLAVALPLLLLFGGLFAAADGVFDALIGGFVRWLLQDLVVRLIVSALVAYLVAGYLRQVLMGPTMTLAEATDSGKSRRPGLGWLEIVIILGALDLLFLTFVIIQLRYLFGGAEIVAISAQLTYADYARRGFFELVWVAALTLPMLLGLDWLRRPGEAVTQRLYGGLAGLMVLLVMIIVASALMRMNLYQREYGLTELRVYTTAFMLWIAIVCVWFAITVLPQRRHYFAAGALLSGLLVVTGLNYVNPDDLIIRTNVGRVTMVDTRASEATGRGRPGPTFDSVYATQLSGDATPALLDVWPHLSTAERRVIARHLLQRWASPATGDWRSANWSRYQAEEAVLRHRRELEAAGGQVR